MASVIEIKIFCFLILLAIVRFFSAVEVWSISAKEISFMRQSEFFVRKCSSIVANRHNVISAAEFLFDRYPDDSKHWRAASSKILAGTKIMMDHNVCQDGILLGKIHYEKNGELPDRWPNWRAHIIKQEK